MFDRLKKMWGGQGTAASVSGFSTHDSVLFGDWAKSQGMAYTDGSALPTKGGYHNLFELEGTVHHKKWRIECGPPSRDFIRGQELRARGELGVLDSVAVVLMNRPLKVALEKRAYSMYTDSLQTAVDPKLPEEMRWLAIYPEVGWADAPNLFFDRYAVLSGKREHAAAWIKGSLAHALMHWPPSGPSSQVPFVMMLLRGRCYLRMQFTDMDMATLQHTISLYVTACTSALDNVSQDLSGDHGAAAP